MKGSFSVQVWTRIGKRTDVKRYARFQHERAMERHNRAGQSGREGALTRSARIRRSLKDDRDVFEASQEDLRVGLAG
jgi:hypothetical protein